MSPFKAYYAQSIEKWLKHNPRRKVTIYQIGEMFGEAFLKAATYQIAVNGFRAIGLFLVNRNYFTEADFLFDSKNLEKILEALKPVTIGLLTVLPQFVLKLKIPLDCQEVLFNRLKRVLNQHRSLSSPCQLRASLLSTLPQR